MVIAQDRAKGCLQPSAGMSEAEVLLVFPPITEARLFPYLSLPMLAAYLRRAGIAVQQYDLNLELAHHLFSPAHLKNYIKAGLGKGDLKTRYRIEMASFLLRHHSEFATALVTKQHPHMDIGAVVRFIRQGIDLLAEGSVYMRPPTTLIKTMELAASLLSNARGVDRVCLATVELLAEAMLRVQPRFVGISVPFFSQLLPSLHLAHLIKRTDPSCTVIFGGPQIMLRHEDLSAVPGIANVVDGLCVGAGEITLIKLMEAHAGHYDIGSVPGLVWLPEKQIVRACPPESPPLDSLPTPDFSSLHLHRYLCDEVQLPLITCVGCYWGRCCFCSYGNRSHRTGSYQEMSPARIAEHCLTLIGNYGFHRINFVDENTNLKPVLGAVRLLEKVGEQITFSTRNRLDKVLLSPDFCSELATRGCVLMSAGYETNSQRLLDLMNKGIKASHYQRIIDNLHEAGIPLRLSVMGGLFDETPEELQASIAFLRNNADKIGIDVMQMLVAEPKTYLTDTPSEYGVALIDNGDLHGNELLNFCMGRMGSKILYPDGDSFQRRLEEFLDYFYEVHPQKNDELYPALRRMTDVSGGLLQSATTSPHDLAPGPSVQEQYTLELEPWVRVLQVTEGPSHSLLVDLLWQKFYNLPSSIELTAGKRRLVAGDAVGGNRILRQLETLGAGKATALEQRS